MHASLGRLVLSQCRDVASYVSTAAALDSAARTEKSGSAPPAVKNIELKAGIRWEKLGYFLQPLGQWRRRQERVFALPQLVIVHVQTQGEQVDGNRVRKCGVQIP